MTDQSRNLLAEVDRVGFVSISAVGGLWRHGGVRCDTSRVLEAENADLKKLLAEAMLDNESLKAVHGESGNARRRAVRS